MNPLRRSASKPRLDLQGRIRNISREVGRGVTEALQEKPAGEEPGWRAEQAARGALRAFDGGPEDDQFRQRLAEMVEAAAESALAGAVARSPAIRELSEDAARGIMRGVIDELCVELGPDGDGRFTRSLAASTRRVASAGASAVTTPLLLLAAAAGLGLLGALVWRRP